MKKLLMLVLCTTSFYANARFYLYEMPTPEACKQDISQRYQSSINFIHENAPDHLYTRKDIAELEEMTENWLLAYYALSDHPEREIEFGGEYCYFKSPVEKRHQRFQYLSNQKVKYYRGFNGKTYAEFHAEDIIPYNRRSGSMRRGNWKCNLKFEAIVDKNNCSYSEHKIIKGYIYNDIMWSI